MASREKDTRTNGTRSLAPSSGDTAFSRTHDVVGRVKEALRWRLDRAGRGFVERGVPPAIFGYRWVARETLEARIDRGPSSSIRNVRTIHEATSVVNPLPVNVSSRASLPHDRGWWGYSMHDVPERRSDATTLAELEEATVLPVHDANGEFRPAILSRDRRSVEMREISLRGVHRALLRDGAMPVRRERAVWFAERVYHNHSHWLTAHVPKLLLLRDLDLLDQVVLPEVRTPVMDSTLDLMGLDPSSFATFEIGRPLEVARLIVLSTDRFRPELLRSAREALAPPSTGTAFRKVYISRSQARRRRLVNEDAAWSILQDAGFQRVHMEELDFKAQVDLMRETRVLVAPHGAGLTNMMFCPEGARVVEIADLSFPNPNFYAMACAMGHEYWLLAAEGIGDDHPLEKDLRVEPRLVEDVLPDLLEPQETVEGSG